MTHSCRTRSGFILAVLVAAAGVGVPVEGVAARKAITPEDTAVTDSAWLAQLGFFQRKASGRALLALTGDEMGTPRSVIERLESIDGVEVITHNYGRAIRLRVGTPDECQPEFFMNGTRVQRRGGQGSLWFLDLLRPHEVDGFELYHGTEAPVGLPEDCGAFLVWSKVRADRETVDFSGILYGRVIDSNGAPLRDCPVTLEPGGHADRTDAQGQFTFVRIIPSLVSVRAGPGDDGFIDEIEVRAFGRTTVEIIRDNCSS
jgi:hypothetical protein